MHISIVGITGYTGLELLHLALATKDIGTAISDIYPHLKGIYDLKIRAFDRKYIMKHSDIVFFATPSGIAKDLTTDFVKTQFPVIDLSDDHRLNPEIYQKWYKKPPVSKKFKANLNTD